jgi:hypothetical protein
MERLRSLFWSTLTAMAAMGMLTGLATPWAMAGPTVKITEPSHGQTVAGEIIIKVAYRSDSSQPVSRLEILIDGELAREYPLAAPRVQGEQSFTWDFTFAANTAHKIGARAIDASGEAGSAEITVTVQSAVTRPGRDQVPPVVNIWYPTQGARLSGEVEIRAEAEDNAGVKSVVFLIDGEWHTILMNAPPFQTTWDTTRSADGPHVLQAKAWDEDDNQGASAEVTVFVENHAMTTVPPSDLTPGETTPGPEPATWTPAPQIVTPGPEVAPQPGVIRTDFGAQGSIATTSRQVQRAESSVSLSGVGYVPAIYDADEAARTSVPRAMLAALPGEEQPYEPASVSVPDRSLLPGHTIEPCSDLEGTRVAALTDSQRLTTPRALPGASVVKPTVAEPARGTAAPAEPQIAALDVGPRTTMPSARTAEPVAEGAARGWVHVDPVLEVAPEAEIAWVQRTTTPDRTLEAGALEPAVLSQAAAESIVIRVPDDGELGTMVARLEQRTTTPGSPAEAEAIAELVGITGETQVVRVAVLPEEATHAAIPADGRLTGPGGAEVAPVATMSFDDVKILFDSEALKLRAQPEMKEGISIAPLREIFEHTDGVLYWFPVEKRVRAVNQGTDIRLQIGDPSVRVNDQTKVLEVAPYIKRGRTMVPLQFLANTLDVTITFDPDNSQIRITSNKF